MSEEKKICFIIMPISDPDEYEDGHFTRVYEHLLKPACEEAGFKPVRADDIVTTNYIAIDILKKIIDSPMALCDLSSRNPNVLYELGIRQAFNLPVSLIKDTKTQRVFDIQGFRDLEYDENLRIDNIKMHVPLLSELILNTFNNHKKEVNSLISLLGIEPAKISEKTVLSPGTEIILNSLDAIREKLTSLEEASSFNIERQNSRKATHTESAVSAGNYASAFELEKGMRVSHPKFGLGTVVNVDTTSKDHKAAINFDHAGTKTLLTSFSKISILRPASGTT